ncbi:hypothetical protein SUGI_0288040 [Cryptomeria japonica]|nr:hypothetical protein SUGI_0288040 [Cryptomeria japonica]
MEDLAIDKIVNNGVGLVLPERVVELYDALHLYLSRTGIDGMKVNVIHILELLSEGLGRRVELAKAYFNGLSESMRKYFKGNEVIASMEHCNDFVYLGTEQITLDRVGRIKGCIQGRLLALLRRGRISIHRESDLSSEGTLNEEVKRLISTSKEACRFSVRGSLTFQL